MWTKNPVLLLVALLWLTTSADSDTLDEELEVVLEFVEFDFEDACVRRNDALWAFRNGSQPDLKQLATAEEQHSSIIHKEIKQILDANHDTMEHSSRRLTRLLDLFLHPGALYLAPQEFQEALEFSIKLEEQNMKAVASLDDGRNLTGRQVEKLLMEEKEESVLKEVWTRWQLGLQDMPDSDWLHHLTLLDLEAEVNGEDELSKYWLKQSDVTWVDYEQVISMWQEIIPLYQKLRQFIGNSIVNKYGKDAIIDQKLIPVHLMGSLDTTDWITAADKLGALDQSQSYQYLKKELHTRNHQEVFRMADNFTSQIHLGPLPARFYNESRFYVEGEMCEGMLTEYCKPDYSTRVMTCALDPVTPVKFILAHQDVMRAKHLMEAGKEGVDNGHLMREGPRDSVLFEAMSSLASVLALNSGNLHKQKLLPEVEGTNQSDDSITSLLLTALHIIPAMPYYLASDLWRIKALKELDTLTTTEMDNTVTEESDILERRKRETEDYDYEEQDDLSTKTTTEERLNLTETNAAEEESTVPVVVTTPTPVTPKVYNERNITAEWWGQREALQGMGRPGDEFQKDFIQDKRIIWNKPYISALLRSGKSVSSEETLMSVLNISEFSTKALRDYFEPLEVFLASGGSFQTKRTPLFNENDFKLFTQSSSLNSKRTVTAAAEGSDVVLYFLAVVAGIGAVAMVITVLRRRQRHKRLRKARRTRTLDPSFS